MSLRFAVVTLGVLGSTAHAEQKLAYVGFAVAQQSVEMETPAYKLAFDNTYVGLEGYGLFAPAYFKISHGIYGFLGTTDTVPLEAKDGSPPSEGEAEYQSGQALLLLPRMEIGGALFPGKPIHPTIGGYIGDSVQTFNGSSVFYSVDLGIAAGVAVALGGKKFGLVVHPTFRVFTAIRGTQEGFEPGSGTGLDVVAAIKLFGKVAVFTRAGYETHSHDTTSGWFGSDPESTSHLSHEATYVHVGLAITMGPQ